MPEPHKLIEQAQAFFVGGGNTFRLLKSLQDFELLWTMRAMVLNGKAKYIGASAGANLACPTIRTTNDMPIVEPRNLDALKLIPFQINPHYVDSHSVSQHMGETRETRINEFLEENNVPVVGLREGSWLTISGESMTLGGNKTARIFSRGLEPIEIPPRSSGSPMSIGPTGFLTLR